MNTIILFYFSDNTDDGYVEKRFKFTCKAQGLVTTQPVKVTFHKDSNICTYHSIKPSYISKAFILNHYIIRCCRQKKKNDFVQVTVRAEQIPHRVDGQIGALGTTVVLAVEEAIEHLLENA